MTLGEVDGLDREGFAARLAGSVGDGESSIQMLVNHQRASAKEFSKQRRMRTFQQFLPADHSLPFVIRDHDLHLQPQTGGCGQESVPMPTPSQLPTRMGHVSHVQRVLRSRALGSAPCASRLVFAAGGEGRTITAIRPAVAIRPQIASRQAASLPVGHRKSGHRGKYGQTQVVLQH